MHRAPSKIGDKYTMGKMKIRDTKTFLSPLLSDRWLKRRWYTSLVSYTDRSLIVIYFLYINIATKRKKFRWDCVIEKFRGIWPFTSFFFSASFYRENGNIFPETKTYFKMFLRTRYQLAPFTWFWNFIACRVFNLNVVSVSCIGERETNQKRINYYTCTKIYIFYLDTISVTLNIIVTLTAVLINSNFAATSRIRGSHRLTLVVILFISGTFWFH